MVKDVFIMEYYSVMEKNEVLPIVVVQMDLEGIMFREIHQTGKDKYCVISLISGI